MSEIPVGRLLRANSRGCVAGCQISQTLPPFGSMVLIQIGGDENVFGLITNIFIDDDGLVRQLAASNDIPEAIIQDNRLNRNAPVELSVRFIGWSQNGSFLHLLPPSPPLSLDRMHACGNDEICEFTSAANFAYLRHVLSVDEVPPADLAAAHFRQAAAAHALNSNSNWIHGAIQAAIQLLRDDYMAVTALLTACSDLFDQDQTTTLESKNG